MPVRREEVGAVDHVLAKLGRVGDRDRLDDRAGVELELSVFDREPSVDVGERRPERRDSHVAHSELDRRVDAVKLEDAAEGLILVAITYLLWMDGTATASVVPTAAHSCPADDQRELCGH